MENTNNFRSKILEIKKKAFENAVRKYSKELGLDRPLIVSITEPPCPYSSPNEIAHIHLDKGVICIRKKKLESIDIDTIEDTADHEVAHLVSPYHDTKHENAQITLKIRGLSPPPGVAIVHGGERENSKLTINSKKYEYIKNVCSYYSCKKGTDLHKCKYCGEKFCTEHLSPKNPLLPPFEGKPEKLEKWRKIGHPCSDYRV